MSISLSSSVVRWSSPASIAAGLLWIGSAIATARLPVGCVADACSQPGRSMREGTTITAVLFTGALILVIVSVIGLFLRARGAGRLSRAGRLGLISSAAGLATIVIAGAVAQLFFDGDFPLMPFFIIPGGIVAIAGFLVTGIAVLRAGLLPRWAGTALIVGTLAMLGFNDQDARVLLAIPFGLAFIAVGVATWPDRSV